MLALHSRSSLSLSFFLLHLLQMTFIVADFDPNFISATGQKKCDIYISLRDWINSLKSAVDLLRKKNPNARFEVDPVVLADANGVDV